VGVRIDEAWRDNETRPVDLSLCVSSRIDPDEDDAIAFDADV
jgi:hypothetical protein